MNKYKYNLNFRLERRKDKKSGNPQLSNLQILADIAFNGTRMFYYSGYRIDSDKWVGNDEKTGAKVQRVKRNNFNERGESATVINARISEIESAVKKVFQRLEGEGSNPTVPRVRSELKTILNEDKEITATVEPFWNAYDRYNEDVKASEGRKRHRKSTINLFKRFERETNRSITFENSDHELISKFEKFLINDGKDPKKYAHLPPKERPKTKSGNRIVNILKMLRAFYSWAKSKKLIKDNPFDEYKIGSESYGEPIYLTKGERDRLFDAEIENDRLRRVRDIFVFQCLVGCRVGDLIQLKKDNIINGVLRYIPRKTKKGEAIVASVPLSGKAKEILSRYDIPDGSLLPFISDQRYNDYLKELFEQVGLNRVITRLNPKTREEEKVPLYSIASSHMARRTFVGTLHRNVKDSVIASMSGHAKDSRAFGRYYAVKVDQQEEAINKFLD